MWQINWNRTTVSLLVDFLGLQPGELEPEVEASEASRSSRAGSRNDSAAALLATCGQGGCAHAHTHTHTHAHTHTHKRVCVCLFGLFGLFGLCVFKHTHTPQTLDGYNDLLGTVIDLQGGKEG